MTHSSPFTGVRKLSSIRLFTVLASIALSLLGMWLNEHPNNDTYTYIRAAEIALQNGVQQAYQHYEWAHFSVLMAGVHTVTGLSLLSSANLINTALFALLSLAFVNLVASMTQSMRVAGLAAVVILLYPHLNEFRPYVIRDTGFLAFMLLSAYYLIRYNQAVRLRHGLSFVAMVILASLFRPEALLFLVLAPLCLLGNNNLPVRERRQAWLRIAGLTLLLAIAVGLVFSLSTISLADQLKSFTQIYQVFLPNLGQLAGINNTELNITLFGEHAAQYVGNYTGWFLIAGLLALLLACIIDSLGLAVAPLLAYAWLKRLVHLPAHVRPVLVAYILIALAILVVFTLLTRFVTTRYTLLLCTLLLVFMPFIIDRLWSLAAASQRWLRFSSLMLVLGLYAALDAHVSFGASKAHLEEGNQWIAQFTRPGAALLTNEFYIAYASGRVADYDLTERIIDNELLQSAEPGTIIAITPRRENLEYIDAALLTGELRLLQRFAAERGADLWVLEKEL